MSKKAQNTLWAAMPRTAPAPGRCEVLVGGILHKAVPALDRVAAGGIDPCPALGPERQLLAVACPDVGSDRDRLLGADLRRLQRRDEHGDLADGCS